MKLLSPAAGILGLVINLIFLIQLERIKSSPLFSGKFDRNKAMDYSDSDHLVDNPYRNYGNQNVGIQS